AEARAVAASCRRPSVAPPKEEISKGRRRSATEHGHKSVSPRCDKNSRAAGSTRDGRQRSHAIPNGALRLRRPKLEAGSCAKQNRDSLVRYLQRPVARRYIPQRGMLPW